VEGAEDKVIRGGQDIIAKHHPLLWFECWVGLESGVQINKRLSHFDLLADCSYTFFMATLFKLNDEWIPESDKRNPAQLMPFDPPLVNLIPAIGCDIIAATARQRETLAESGLISKADAKSHILASQALDE
jgi:hypothetical protein